MAVLIECKLFGYTWYCRLVGYLRRISFKVVLGSTISEPLCRVALLASVLIFLSNCSNEATKPFTVRSPFQLFRMCNRRKQRTGMEMILQLCFALRGRRTDRAGSSPIYTRGKVTLPSRPFIFVTLLHFCKDRIGATVFGPHATTAMMRMSLLLLRTRTLGTT